MEALYAKLYDKYTKLKVNKFSDLDVLNKDQEVKFVNYVTVAEEVMDFLKKENDELKFQNNNLRNEMASICSSRDEQIAEYQKLLMEENEKNRSLSEELEKLRNLQREGLSGSSKDNTNTNIQFNTSGGAPIEPVDIPNVSSQKMKRKQRRQSLFEAEDLSTQAMSGQKPESVKHFSKETMPSGALISTQQPECSRRTIDSSGGENDNSRTNCMFQFLVECLLGMKISTLNQNGEISISALHESSGYSINLSMVHVGAGKEVQLMIRVLSLGILERVVPECMREDIIVSRNMSLIFFERVFQVINIHT